MKYRYLVLVITIGALIWSFYPRSAPPPGRRMSAENVYFLLGYASGKTPRGMAGFAPGQRVLRVASYNGEFKQGYLAVTDGEITIPVEQSLLTHDIELAAQLAREDAQSQASLAAASADALKSELARQTATNIASAQRVQFDTQRQIAANRIGSRTRLDDPTVIKRGGGGGGPVIITRTNTVAVPAASPAYHSPLFDYHP